jgi:hypothetical protein
MKKIHIFWLAVVAVAAFSALATASASATQWLINGNAVTELTPVDIEGELELTDLKTAAGAATVKCSGILDGSVGPGGEDEITQVLTLAGGLISSTPLSGTPLLCTGVKVCSATAEEVEVWPLNLPWLTQLELVGGTTFRDHIFTTAGETNNALQPGYEINNCLVIGINTTDDCKGLGFAALTNEGSNVDAIFEKEPLGECELGGAASGEIKGLGTILTISGLSLAVSE